MRGRGEKNHDRIIIKFCTGVGAPDVIIYVNSSDLCSEFFFGRGAEVEFITFQLTSVVVHKTVCDIGGSDMHQVRYIMHEHISASTGFQCARECSV